MSKLANERQSDQIDKSRPQIILNEFFFKQLLESVNLVEEKHRDIFLNAVTSSCQKVCKFVGHSLARMLGEFSKESEAKELSSEQLFKSGGSHQLETALSPATIATGYVGTLVYPYERPQYPMVNGKHSPEELITDEEREEWRLQQERFEQQRAAEVHALKLLAFRYVLGAARAYLETEAVGGDVTAALAAHGVPEAAREIFEREVVARLRRMPPDILRATFQDVT